MSTTNKPNDMVDEKLNVEAFSSGQREYLDYHRELAFLETKGFGAALQGAQGFQKSRNGCTPGALPPARGRNLGSDLVRAGSCRVSYGYCGSTKNDQS
jgi:hypothetical protein